MRAENRIPPERSRPSVALIVLDTLRADLLDDGRAAHLMPNLSRLLQESYVFSRAYAPSHWTLPSHASLFTGLPPSEHGARSPGLALREDVTTIAEVASDKGYSTACLTCNPFVGPNTGTARGFEEFWLPSKRRLRLVSEMIRYWARRWFEPGITLSGTMCRLMELAADLMSTSPLLDNGSKPLLRHLKRVLRTTRFPLFLFVNLLEAHSPYFGRGKITSWKLRAMNAEVLARWYRARFALMNGRIAVSERVRENLKTMYAEAVRYLDLRLHTLMQLLKENIPHPYYLIVLSDHGQAWGEKGNFDHMAGLGGELLRVPVAIRPPSGVRRTDVHLNLDITWINRLLREIVLGKAHRPIKDWLEWVQSRPFVIGEAHGEIVPHVVYLRGLEPRARKDILSFKVERDRPAVSCIAENWKLICNLGEGEDELYNIKVDPHETVNRARTEPNQLWKLHDGLRARFLDEIESPGSYQIEIGRAGHQDPSTDDASGGAPAHISQDPPNAEG